MSSHAPGQPQAPSTGAVKAPVVATPQKLSLQMLLKAMIDKDASDLHITAGTPPQLRIDGRLVPLKTPVLTPVDTKQLCYSVLADSQRERFEISSIALLGDLGIRATVEVFEQEVRHASFRETPVIED